MSKHQARRMTALATSRWNSRHLMHITSKRLYTFSGKGLPLHERQGDHGGLASRFLQSPALQDRSSTPKAISEDRALTDLVDFVRRSSPYYHRLYRSVFPGSDIPSNVKLSQLPVVDHTSYWQANTICDSQNAVRTSPQADGILFKTGGTTGNPKYTAVSQLELQSTCTQLGSGLIAAGVQAGDRVANLFYAGECYGSFLIHVLSLMSCPVPLVHVPIGGLGDPATTAKLLSELQCTAILSTVTSLMRIADLACQQNTTSHAAAVDNEACKDNVLPAITFPHIRAIMFGGEPLYPDQRTYLQKVFPNATFRGCIFGSMDAGIIGEAVSDEDPRVYKTFAASVRVEICSDDDGMVAVEENQKEGNLIVTSLVRRLTPVIRYPTGDRAEWVDKAAGIFRLLGRAQLSLRIGPVSLDMQDLRGIICKALLPTPVRNVQAVLRRENGLEGLECLVVAEPQDPESAANRVGLAIFHERPMLKQHIVMKLIAPLRVSFVSPSGLHVNTHSGKTKDIVDLR